jgi:hypothetical protein
VGWVTPRELSTIEFQIQLLKDVSKVVTELGLVAPGSPAGAYINEIVM